MQEPPVRPSSPGPLPPEVLSTAFRDLHAARLHGFALLLTLGDRALGARLTADALRAAAARTGELRHPERAAAWLRARVVRALPRNPTPAPDGEQRAGLEPLDVDDAVLAGLAELDPRARAALVASSVERLDRRDVETIVGRRGDALDRLLLGARRTYLAAYAAAAARPPLADGPITARVRELVARTMQ